ncbi:hypothetical protein EON65_42470, partial [archaeon]
MKGRRKNYIRLLLIVVVLFLSVVLILYFHLHKVNPPALRHPHISPSRHKVEVKHQNAYVKANNNDLPKRHLSVGLVKTSSNLPLYDAPQTSVNSPNVTAYVHSGTLLLLDASNSIAYHNLMSIEVVFPYHLWLVVENAKFSSTIQFVSIFRTNANSNNINSSSNSNSDVNNNSDSNQLQDYVNECMVNSNQSRFCLSSQEHYADYYADHPLLRMLTSPYVRLEDYQERQYATFQFDVEVSHADWTQQLPLMNGRMGAMVGGSRYHEVSTHLYIDIHMLVYIHIHTLTPIIHAPRLSPSPSKTCM